MCPGPDTMSKAPGVPSPNFSHTFATDYLRDRLPSRPICITTVAVMSTSRRRGAIIGRASFHASTPRTPHPAVAERYGMRGPVEPKLALAKADDRDLVL